MGPYDICLFLPFSPGVDVVLRTPCTEGVARKPRKPYPPYVPEDERPPVARSLYDSLLERYGPREGPEIFARMAAERKGPFAPGAKYDLADPRVERKVERAGGVLPDPLKGRDDPPLA